MIKGRADEAVDGQGSHRLRRSGSCQTLKVEHGYKYITIHKHALLHDSNPLN